MTCRNDSTLPEDFLEAIAENGMDDLPEVFRLLRSAAMFRSVITPLPTIHGFQHLARLETKFGAQTGILPIMKNSMTNRQFPTFWKRIT